MRTKFILIFLFSLNFCFSQRKANKVLLEPYHDSLVFYNGNFENNHYSGRPIYINNINYIDTTFRKYLILNATYPIRKELSISKFKDSSILDKFHVNALTGIFQRNEFTDYTFFSPASRLKNSSILEIPKSAVYYQNPSDVKVDLNHFQLTSNSISSKNINDYLKPFLFSNREVSNSMYRKFVDYVRDSIGREVLAKNMSYIDWKVPTYDTLGNLKDSSEWILNYEKKVDWEKYADNDQFIFLSELYLGFGTGRFYNLLEVDTRKLNYKYQNEKGDTVLINVYSDTVCWLSNFSNQSLEPMANMYFWHPAYDDYPVVGISWHQAKAYCHWLTKETNKTLQTEKFPYCFKFDLPSMIQWDYVREEIRNEMNSINNVPFSWETNLILTESMSKPIGDGGDSTYLIEDFEEKKGSLTRKNALISSLNNMGEDNYNVFNQKYLNSWYNIPEFKKGNHISNVRAMGTGVSEWLQESYQDNWKLMYYKRMELLIKSSGADTDIQALREEYFNAYNHPKGRMVIGANWYDYRDEYYEGKTFESMDAKVFADPDKGYATVGFRLIATFEPLED